MISTFFAIIVTFTTHGTMSVTGITVSNNASISIPAPILLLSLWPLVRVPAGNNT